MSVDVLSLAALLVFMQTCGTVVSVDHKVHGCTSGNVRDCGAKGDGVTYDTDAVRAAANSNTGILFFSAPGVYLTGAFNISANTKVIIETNATVLGSTRGHDWPLIVARTVWPQMGHGSDCVPGTESCRLMHQALVFGWDVHNISLSGGGTLDCNSQPSTWWGCAKDLSKPPCNGYGRPHCLLLSNTTDIEVDHVVVKNSPDWTLHFSSCTNVHVHDVNVLNPLEPNADGIDIDSSQNVLVENNYFSVGDDALCVKSGIDYFGRLYGRPAKDIVFRNNVIGTGHGITIGSEMSGGVQNVTFENITMENTGTGVRMKSQRGRGGEVRDIVYRNILMKSIEGQCIQITLNYHEEPVTNKSATPVFQNILLENIHCAKAANSFLLDGLEEQHVQNLTLRNVTMGDGVGKQLTCEFVDCVCEQATSPCPSCCKPQTTQPTLLTTQTTL